jgi:Tfp pilus assembly protein PilN
MFKIDLLNGQAIPLKSKPGSLAIITVTVVIPIAVAMGMLSVYMQNKIVVSMKKQEINRCQAEIDKLSDAVGLQKALEQKKIAYGDYLSEVKLSIKRHTQWSPVLTILMENIPNSVVLTSLAVNRSSVKRKAPQKDDPSQMVEIEVPIKILRLSVSGGPQSNCDEAVRDFRDRIRDSAFLGPKLENIGVSQKSETLEGQNVVSYEISCVFKPGV